MKTLFRVLQWVTIALRLRMILVAACTIYIAAFLGRHTSWFGIWPGFVLIISSIFVGAYFEDLAEAKLRSPTPNA